MQPRISRLRRVLDRENLDAIIVTQPENRRYLSGFSGSSGVLLITSDMAMLATDFRYYEQVAEQAPEFELVKIETNSFAQLLAQMIGKTGARTVGFEAQHITVETRDSWDAAVDGFELVSTKTIVEGLRTIKDAAEIEATKRAVELSDSAVEYLRGIIQPGMTEKQVAWELEAHMRTNGADKLAFDIIVGSGPNGAKPHAVTSDRAIQKGEPIVIDLGAQVDGYNSDLTRTICIGKPDDQYQKIYDLVLEAQLAAEKAIRPGMLGKDADNIARKVIAAGGHGSRFGHGLGHGVGLAIHESPRAGMSSEDTLEEGNLLTVEPGIYIPGWGGVRIEDLVLLTKDGVKILSKANKDPLV